MVLGLDPSQPKQLQNASPFLVSLWPFVYCYEQVSVPKALFLQSMIKVKRRETDSYL